MILFITAAYGYYAIAENLNRTESENLNGNHIFAGRAGTICDIIDSIQIEERG